MERQPTKTFGTRKKTDQIRLVALQSGELRHVNDSFASALGLPTQDLIGRNLLDIVLFKNPDELKNDRAIFNMMGEQDSPLSGLQSGAHILLLGPHQKPYNFFFDWVRGQDGKRYLIASSIQEDKPEEWTHFVEEMNAPVDLDPFPAKKKDKNPPRSQKPVDRDRFMTAANDTSQREGEPINNEDMTVFASFNNDYMCVIDTDGTIQRMNTTFEHMIGHMTNGSLLDCVTAENKASVRQFIQSFYKHDAEDAVQGDTAEFETRMESTAGNPIWVKWTIHQKDDALYCLGHDITEAKDNETFLKRREQELSEAQALANMGHWRWTVGSARIEWSDQIYKIFGVDRDFDPTLENANSLLHKRDIGHMTQAFQRAIIEQNDYDIDFRVQREDGSTGYVRCEGRCEMDDDGDVIALYGVMQDITAQTEYEMELKKAKDSAEQAYASKSRFLANMSHELRTPLNAIIGFSDMLERQMLGELGNEKYVEYAGSIKSSGEHLLDLITDILDMSKIEAGKYDLDLEKIALGSIVTCAVRMIESRAQEGLITLNNNIEGEDPAIYADRRAVMQILLNILSNAVKFTEPGGSITVGVEEFENHITVKVADTGIGIPANKLSSVLLPFEQVSTAFTRNHEGSGLGLAITKELAELHGGMIALESSEGQGTTASIRLPKDARKKVKK